MGIWNIRTRITIFGIAAVLTISTIMFLYYLVKTEIEGAHVGVIDCFYWTIITITTLGYYPAELTLKSTAGKLLTMATVLSGILLIFVGMPTIAVPWLEKKMEMAIAPRKIPIPTRGHVVVCGYSEVSKQTIDELAMHEVPFVVITKDASREKKLTSLRIPHIIGDPTDSSILSRAYIESALSLVVATDDSTNAFICLTASKLRPDIRIIANLENEENGAIMQRAGVGKAVSSKSMAGLLLAKRALGQYDLDMITRSGFLGGLEIRQYKVNSSSPLKNQTLRSARMGEHSGASVIGIWKSGELTFNPKPDVVLTEGTILVVMGTSEQLSSMKVLVYGGNGHG